MSISGRKHSLETRQEMRLAHLGKKLSLETKQKISKANRGKKHTAAAKRKMSEAASRRQGEKCPAWKRGWYKCRRYGYIYRNINLYSYEEQIILMPMLPKGKNYVREHRAVMALSLGRALRSNELVHHLNRVRDDNHLENLSLVIQGNHMGEFICPCCDCIINLR